MGILLLVGILFDQMGISKESTLSSFLTYVSGITFLGGNVSWITSSPPVLLLLTFCRYQGTQLSSTVYKGEGIFFRALYSNCCKWTKLLVAEMGNKNMPVGFHIQFHFITIVVISREVPWYMWTVSYN